MKFPDYIAKLSALYSEQGGRLHLKRGAGAATLDAAERRLGFPLAAELRGVWQFANGGRDWETVFSRPGFLTGYSLFSVAQALQERAGMAARCPRYASYDEPRPRDPRIRPGWFHDGWLPFAGFGGASLLLIQDYTPAAPGQPGQIIAFSHDPDRIDHVAPSLAALLRPSLQNIRRYPDDLLEVEAA